MNKIIKWCTSNNTKAFWSAFIICFSIVFGLIVWLAPTLPNLHELKIWPISKPLSEDRKLLEWILAQKWKLDLTIFYIPFSISIITGFLFLFLRLLTTKEPEEKQIDDDDILINDLIESLKKELDKNKNQEVITIGSILSNPLFTIGKYELRLAIGKLVKKAAIAQFAIFKDNKYKECEMIQLIDSIGWMKVELGYINEGRTDIDNGRKIAETLNTNKGKFFESKAYRHFGAIERRRQNWQKAIEYNDKCLAIANEITDEQLNIEAIAAAHYARAFVYKGKDNYIEALNSLEMSLSYFEQLTDSEKKIMKMCMTNEAKARFLFYSKQNENDYDVISSAKRLFEDTLSVAEHNTLRIEMIRCCIGLAECNLHFNIDNPIEAKQYIDKAKNIKIKCVDDQNRLNDVENKLKR